MFNQNKKSIENRTNLSLNNITKNLFLTSLLIGSSLSSNELTLNNINDIEKIHKIINQEEVFKNLSHILNKEVSVINRIEKLNQIKDLETRTFFIEKFITELEKIQNKYDRSLIDYPNSKNLEEQVKNILNSNLKELCDQRILKAYSTLKNIVKFDDIDDNYRELLMSTIREVEKLSLKLDTINFNPYNTILEVTYDAPNISRETNEDIKNKIFENKLNNLLSYFVSESFKEEVFSNIEIQLFKNYLVLKEINLSNLNKDTQEYLNGEIVDMEDRIISILNELTHERSIGLNYMI